MSAAFACDLSALDPFGRSRHRSLSRAVVRSARIRRTADGYRFEWDDPERLFAVAEFAGLERLCCPFLRLRIELAPGGGPLALELTGEPGVHGFLEAELQLAAAVPPVAAARA